MDKTTRLDTMRALVKSMAEIASDLAADLSDSANKSADASFVAGSAVYAENSIKQLGELCAAVLVLNKATVTS